jgi:hypothetical protein
MVTGFKVTAKVPQVNEQITISGPDRLDVESTGVDNGGLAEMMCSQRAPSKHIRRNRQP